MGVDIINITDLGDERIDMFARLTEAQLRNRLHAELGVFIAESPKVIRVALDAGYEPLALLCERRHIEGDAASLTGYTLTRGVLCAMRRPVPKSVEDVCRGASRIAVVDSVVDSTNIGAIFRSAAALGIDAVLVTQTSCDPLNRRAVRVSMGSVFLVPWTWTNTLNDDAQDFEHHYINKLHTMGFKTAAMALVNRSINLNDICLKSEQRLAIILGNEGDGLPASTIERADYVVKIPMRHGVDSLNVAAASAVAFWELGHES